ncbi:MAG TPA: hypothetical protein VLX68_00565 [Chitinivibrionales bacterium]|nr:hypothetical protein [Chitinivibrionales bacterium]
METAVNSRLLLIWTGIIMLTAFIGYLDYITGYEFYFFVFYFIPISIAAWYVGPASSVVASFLSALTWFAADYYTGHTYSHHLLAVWNTLILLTSFVIMGWTLARLRELYGREHRGRQELERAMSEVKVLEGILPICASCKKIRNDKGEWQKLETYLGQKTNAEFTHGLCPECARKLLQDAGIAPDAEKKE